MKTIFEETQQFRQKWLWALLIGIFIFTSGMSALVYLSESSQESLNTIILTNTISTAILVILLLLFYILKLTTKISSESLEMHYFPFTKRKVFWNEIESAELIDYGFVGGWGIRLWTKYGTVYNVNGGKGLHIKLKNGKQFLIGTQKSDELENALKEVVFS